MNDVQRNTLKGLSDELLVAISKCAEYHEADTSNLQVGLMLINIRETVQDVLLDRIEEV